jgi:hypothetical protein
MQGNDREQSHQDLWKSQEDGPMQITTDEVRAKARRYERENVLVFWAMLGLTPLFLALFIYNVVRLREPLLVQVGGGLAVATFCCIAGRFVWKGPNRIVPGEPCVHFLRREFEGKRQGLLWARRWWLLLVPAMLASWWGGGPLRGKALGIRPSWWPSLLKEYEPLIVTSLVVAFVWFAFWKEGRKVEREIDKLGKE